MDMNAHLKQHGSFDRQGLVGGLIVRCISHVDVIRFVARHHLVAADAMQDNADIRPLAAVSAPRGPGGAGEAVLIITLPVIDAPYLLAALGHPSRPIKTASL
jgi:hypothetical protein